MAQIKKKENCYHIVLFHNKYAGFMSVEPINTIHLPVVFIKVIFLNKKNKQFKCLLQILQVKYRHFWELIKLFISRILNISLVHSFTSK